MSKVPWYSKKREPRHVVAGAILLAVILYVGLFAAMHTAEGALEMPPLPSPAPQCAPCHVVC
jgi:hypothetical protein